MMWIRMLREEAKLAFWKKAKFFPLVLLLTGCSSALGLGGDSTPDLIYDLVVPDQANLGIGAGTSVLFFEPITYPAFIDTEKIAIKPSPQEIRYLSDARWQDNGPDLISRYLVISLGDLDNVTVIDRDDAARAHQYLLSVDIRDFSAHIEGDGIPVAHVIIVADLMATSPLSVIDQQSFSRQVRADANSKDAIIRAFNAAIQGVTSDLVHWIETETK